MSASRQGRGAASQPNAGAHAEAVPRRWRILSYLAQHGSASTLDVAFVCAVLRLTAHRDFVWLHEAGLVRCERSPEDRSHTWWYGVTAERDRGAPACLDGVGAISSVAVGSTVLRCGGCPAVPAAGRGVAAQPGAVRAVPVAGDDGDLGVVAAARHRAGAGRRVRRPAVGRAVPAVPGPRRPWPDRRRCRRARATGVRVGWTVGRLPAC